MGTYSGPVNFGGGTTTAPAAGAGFLLVYDDALNHVLDRTFTYPGAPVATCATCSASGLAIAIGPSDSTGVSGRFRGHIDLDSVRRSADSESGFLVRLGN
ncbi:MAG: hypothetical protein AB8I08_07355 [Sandaracinaceae bacterium]